MEIHPDLQPQRLLVRPASLAKHLQAMLKNDISQENLNSINTQILHQTHTEAVTCSVYQVWLFLAWRYSPRFLPAALRDQTSAGVRKAGIKIVRKIFSRLSQQVRGWSLLGGPEGIKAILDGLPLAELRLFVKAISQSGHHPDSGLLETYFDELMAIIDASDIWTTRSISRYVAPLYAHCSAGKATEALRSGITSSRAFCCHLGHIHPQLLRQIATGAVEVPHPVRLHILETCAEALLQSNKPYIRVHATETYPGNHPGLTFGVDLLLQIKANNPGLRANGPLIRQWTGRILDLAIRRRLPFDAILPIINLSLGMCRVADSSSWFSQYLPKEVIRCWSVARFGRFGDIEPFHAAMKTAGALSPSRPGATSQVALSKCLIEQVLPIRDIRLSIQVKPAELGHQLGLLLSYVHIDGRLELLQLLCKHLPTLNFDLNAWPPSKDEREIFPVWSYHLLRRLPAANSKSLFQRSLQIQNCDTFISDDLLERNTWALDWESQCFLWASWECSIAKGSNDFPVTHRALAGMKQRATRGREPNERFRWANAAIRLASATKCLDIFRDLVDWCKRFLRDPKVFPRILTAIYSEAPKVFSCGADTRLAKPASELNLRDETHKANLTLKGLLESMILLLREPWALNLGSLKYGVRSMFSDILRQRMDAVRLYTLDRLATESKLVEILLDSLLPILIDYEREGNPEDGKAFSWSDPSGLIQDVRCSDRPSRVELAFMDRLGKARDELWAHLRARSTPDVLLLGPGWPRGLPLQRLVPDKAWLYHALKRPEEAPFLSSRCHQLLFSPQDIILASLPQDVEGTDGFVDNLEFAVHATISRGEQTEKEDWIRRVWEYYSSVLQTHPLQLELFQERLVFILQQSYHRDSAFDAAEALNIIQPPIAAPMISNLPFGLDAAEWDPHEDFEDTVEACKPLIDAKRPKSIPSIVLNSRFKCRGRRVVDGLVFTRDIKSRPRPNPIAIWLEKSSSTTTGKNDIFDNREAVILSALLFLDTYTSEPRLLQAMFPNSEYPRYGPTYLADEFITRVTKAEVPNLMNEALGALKRNTKHVPGQILRNLICSLLNTLKASPDASSYSKVLYCTLELIEILLNSTQPQLVTDAALRLWMDFPNDSSSHRKVSLVKIGRCLTPNQASGIIQSLIIYAGDTVKRPQAPSDGPGKPLMKVTTVKMLAESLSSADFLAPAIRVHLLESLFNARNHLDIRAEMIKSLLKLVNRSNSAHLFTILSTISLCAAGPSERDTVTDDDWCVAEAGGPLPTTLSEHPILNLLVMGAVREIPNELHSDYVQKVVLPLVTESIRQHTRWMSLLLARLSFSLSDLGLTDADIGPFCFGLVESVFIYWTSYIPATFLQCCRSRDFVYLHRDAFRRITEAFELSTDLTIKNDNVRDHLHALLKSQRDQRPFSYADRFIFVIGTKLPKIISDEAFLEDYMSRIEVFSRSPFVYNYSLGRYSIHPGYMLEVLKELRQAGCPPDRRTFVRKLMIGIVGAAERVREEGWSPGLVAYPVTVSAALEYEVQLLPWPPCKPELSSWDLQDFISGVTALISKHAEDPILPIKIDVFVPVLEEVRNDDKVTCALLLGETLVDRNDKHGLMTGWAKVKLSMMLLKAAKKANMPLDGNVMDMIDNWKGSDIEMVRQMAWEWEWSN